MTEKKEKILDTALELFANEGYASTPTIKIARKAGVSEGLIFKHFGNKKGLLKALMKEADSRMVEMLGPILFETNPKKVIRRFIKLPFESLEKKTQHFWKLHFILKWQDEYNRPKKMKALTDKLSAAFSELNYRDPKREAQLLSHAVNHVSEEILRGNMDPSSSFKNFLLEKYK